MTDISYANASFYGCSFASYQDTWYTGRNGSTYVVDSIIYGQTDCGSIYLVLSTRPPLKNNICPRSIRIRHCVSSLRKDRTTAHVFSARRLQLVPERRPRQPRVRRRPRRVEGHEPHGRAGQPIRRVHRRLEHHPRAFSATPPAHIASEADPPRASRPTLTPRR